LVGFPTHACVVHVVVEHQDKTTGGRALRSLLPQNALGLLQGPGAGTVPNVKRTLVVVVLACASKKASFHGVKLDMSHPHLVLFFLPFLP
jgi:hypothetical protein